MAQKREWHKGLDNVVNYKSDSPKHGKHGMTMRKKAEFEAMVRIHEQVFKEKYLAKIEKSFDAMVRTHTKEAAKATGFKDRNLAFKAIGLVDKNNDIDVNKAQVNTANILLAQIFQNTNSNEDRKYITRQNINDNDINGGTEEAASE